MKENLREKLEGNELDLSLSELTDVPVKELAALPKGTRLDLSCNKLQVLPATFATLNHLVKLDLSKNQLIELPDNFGKLSNLQTLDLYGNKLTVLPLSFCNLRNLRWLDLKNNPLRPDLQAIAGDCLDEKQCQKCAKQIVGFMQKVDSDLEREKQKRLKEEREKENLRKIKEENEQKQLRLAKKAEKEKRKAEIKAMKERKLAEERLLQLQDKTYDGNAAGDANDAKSQGKMLRSTFWNVTFLFFSLVLLVSGALVMFWHFQGYKLNSVDDILKAFEDSRVILLKQSKIYWKILQKYLFLSRDAVVLWFENIQKVWKGTSHA